MEECGVGKNGGRRLRPRPDLAKGDMIVIRTTTAVATIIAAFATSVLPAAAANVGLSCMEPSILDTNPNPAFTALPGIFALPSSGSKKIGVATSLVYAVTPLKRVDGFIEVLHPNGATGWVQESAVEPWHNVNTPAARCAAHILPDGKPHAVYSP